jgi:hypothetical protein
MQLKPELRKISIYKSSGRVLRTDSITDVLCDADTEPDDFPDALMSFYKRISINRQ